MADILVGLKAHLVDPNFRRRAELSRLLAERGIHTEIYEDWGEVRRHTVRDGILMIHDGDGAGDLDNFVRDTTNDHTFLPIIAYSETPEVERIVDALRSGVVDYLSWPIEARLLERVLERVTAEIESRAAVALERSRARKLVEKLTSRERDILVCLVGGSANKEIARDLGISPRTVETYRKNMMVKLQADSLVQAVRIALHAGLWSIASSAHERSVFFPRDAVGAALSERAG